MSELRLDLGDAIELAELLTFLTEWLSGSQQQPLANSLAPFLSGVTRTPGKARSLCPSLRR
jgi:hypothetical protein